MTRPALIPPLALAAAALATAAHAEIPPFTAQCPTGITVTWDPAGNVRVNGSPASVRMYNQQYFEATAGGITFPISTDQDGSGLLVGFNPPGSAGGYCTILSQGSDQPDTTAGADGPDHFQVSGASRLNVRSAPSTSAAIVGKLPAGTVVENLGCRQTEGRDWCHISDGDASGWAASEFLSEASGPVRAPRATPVGQDNAANHTVQQVRFPRGSTGTEFTDSLDPQVSHRYVLGARNGQFLYFRLAANGPGMTYVIYNPDGSVLLDEMSSDREYRGQLWQSGDHIVEVHNTANGRQSFNVIFGIN
ncbi:SH3 domain-containing protein [Jannaschia seohaensis]|uniref:SH3 domain-containing protein n=1 Tax=Jannaschia seohaensis TaxID=475081 RepID=A0A2Y9B5Y6_9RHOB|nr:SH3 domain-containing protein [Jannaschia seohaensis]PWJ09658.1 SH3 domain-containing protein [Jannaschia seohaensis]SSA52014.1 SH3 domain-containing protein [Jannaschia seohaensis]